MICPPFATGRTRITSPSLARLWNVDPDQIPHWGPPTHAMEIFRYAEQGSIEFLWVSGTNPAVSLPDLGRIRSNPLPGKSFPCRLRRVPDRDGQAGRCRSAGGAVGREDGNVHEHRPHRPPFREGGRSPRASTARRENLCRLRDAARTQRQGRATTREVVDARRSASKPGKNAHAAARATTPGLSYDRLRVEQAFSGPATTTHPTEQNGCTQTSRSRRSRTSARTTGTTS